MNAKRTFEKSSDWVSSKGCRSVQYKVTHEALNDDAHSQTCITLTQSCNGKSASIAVQRRVWDDKLHTYMPAENPYAGISFEPSEWAVIIKTMQELSR